MVRTGSLKYNNTPMTHPKVKISLIFNYIIFAILLNSVGIVIMRMINEFGIPEESAAVLEAYKDLSIAIFSFVVASFIPRIGYKITMLIALVITAIACVAMPLAGGGFLMSKILFAAVGFSFGLVKVSVYSTVGLVTEGTDEHASFMSILEGLFMVGVLAGFWIFGYFIDSDFFTWLDTYWLLAVISVGAAILLAVTELDESQAQPEEEFDTVKDFTKMFSLLKVPLVLIFILSAFFYVFIEQSIQTWLPTFNNKILQLPESVSVWMSSIYLGALALGRLTSGWVMKKISWNIVLGGSLVFAFILVVLVLPLTEGIEPGSYQGFATIPLAAYLFPLIGFCIAPIYPTLNSTVLSKLPKPRQSPMTGLIVIFSALGGTAGSIITGVIFGQFSGQYAFYFTLVPITIVFLLLFPYKRLIESFSMD